MPCGPFKIIPAPICLCIKRRLHGRIFSRFRIVLFRLPPFFFFNVQGERQVNDGVAHKRKYVCRGFSSLSRVIVLSTMAVVCRFEFDDPEVTVFQFICNGFQAVAVGIDGRQQAFGRQFFRQPEERAQQPVVRTGENTGKPVGRIAVPVPDVFEAGFAMSGFSLK